jgi:hypothetical protein
MKRLGLRTEPYSTYVYRTPHVGQVILAQQLNVACPSGTKRLVTIAGAGHNDLLARGYAPYCAEVRAHFASVLRLAGTQR